MIVAFSTSSRQASVALLARDGTVIWAKSADAPQTASGACMRLLRYGLESAHLRLPEAELFLADLGPGSFTGVRVGVTLAKTFAFALGLKAGGADAFDLVDPNRNVVLPSKRGEWFLRAPGRPPVRTTILPESDWVGVGAGLSDQTYPDAARFGLLLASIRPVEPESLVPAYLIEPSISVPKKPYGGAIAQ